MMLLLDRCCLCLNLRTGVILLATVQLCGCVFSLFLLLFGLSFIYDVNEMLDMDRSNKNNRHSTTVSIATATSTEAFIVSSGGFVTNNNGSTWTPIIPAWGPDGAVGDHSNGGHYNHNREMNIHAAKLLQMDRRVVTTAVFIVCIQSICCGMMLYGAVKRIAKYLRPWLAMVTMGIICNVIGFFLYLFIYGFYPPIVFSAATEIMLGLYFWMCVFSFYQELISEDLSDLIHYPTLTNSLSNSSAGDWKSGSGNNIGGLYPPSHPGGPYRV